MKIGFFSSKTYLILICFLIILLIYVNWQVNKKSDQEKVNLLKKELKHEQIENKKLIDQKEYFSTDIYLERQVREKFKMQKPAEKVIMIKEIEPLVKEPNSQEKNPANILKWWHYLLEPR